MNYKKKYEDFTNYETWSIALFIDNDKEWQEIVLEKARKVGKYEFEVWLETFVREEILIMRHCTDYQKQLLEMSVSNINFLELYEKYKKDQEELLE